MSDATAPATFTLAELAARLGGEVAGENAAAIVVRGLAPLERAGADELSFLVNAAQAARLSGCRAAAIVLPASAPDLTERPRILTRDPYLFYARAMQLFHPAARPVAGVHPRAIVECDVPPCASIGAGAVLAAGVRLGRDVVIGANCVIGENCAIGDGTRLYANVTLYPGCTLGARCIVHSGAVIGADGFGFARERDGAWVKIPQIGSVVIGDDVEIGANTTIDRGALDNTVLANGVKIDNLVQIAHNVQIGEHTAMAGCAGVAGSAKIGARCMVGGQAGISGHLEICDDVIVSAWSLISKSIHQPGIYTASLPQQTHQDWTANFAHLRRLDALARRLRKLEKTIAKTQEPTQ